jgi:hypothetical protein
MIDFPCLCGEKFSLPTDMAGESFQCPLCSRLVMVPTLDDLAHLKPDGTFEINLSDRPVNPVAMDAAETVSLPVRPRFDPETGELIRELEVEKQILSAEAKKPIRRQPLSKSHRRDTVPIPKATDLFRLLLEARSLVVILMMWGLSLFWVILIVEMEMGLAVFYIASLGFMCVMIGHYTAIIQETGPAAKDDLPTPLRDFDFDDDVWDPFWRTLGSIMLCSAPAFVIIQTSDGSLANKILAALAGVAGVLFFPAILLTAATDGSVANFRPDRVWGMMNIARQYYLSATGMMTLGFACYIDGMISVVRHMILLFRDPKLGPPPAEPWFVLHPLIGLFLIMAGLYASYYACWLLGLIWRKHHAQFPWIGQVFERTLPAQMQKNTE